MNFQNLWGIVVHHSWSVGKVLESSENGRDQFYLQKLSKSKYLKMENNKDKDLDEVESQKLGKNG